MRFPWTPRSPWADAVSLADMAELTAQWLEGTLRKQPGYHGPVDVDEDDAPGLTQACVLLNRYGFLTDNSQAGWKGRGHQGARIRQVAWVTGYAFPQTIAELRAHLHGTPYKVHVLTPKRITVTWADGEPVTSDCAVPAKERRLRYPGVGKPAVAQVCAAQQVAIIDHTVGRNTMWADITAALTTPSARGAA